MTAQQKLSVARKLMRSGVFTVSLDPRRLGVTVPMRFRSLSQLDIRVDRSMTGMDDKGIAGAVWTMAGERIGVDVPWHATFAMSSSHSPCDNKVWPRDFPPELKAKLAAAMPGERRMVSGVVERTAQVLRLDDFRNRRAK